MHIRFGKICIKHPEKLGQRVRGDCIACANARKHAWAKANPIKKAKAGKDWEAKNPEKKRKYIRDSQRLQRARNPEKFSYATNKERKKAYVAAYAKRHPAKVNARNRARYAKQVSATPKWADGEIIGLLYWLSSEYRKIGIDCHVDHIVPLKSDIVCGLHVQANLQLLLGSKNASKGNRYWPDMPEH